MDCGLLCNRLGRRLAGASASGHPPKVTVWRAAMIALFVLVPAAVTADEGLLPCVEVEGIARWGAAAYNHYVRVTNRCERRVRCSVATDVNPEPQRITLAAGETQEIITFRGSPARVFVPRVSCSLER